MPLQGGCGRWRRRARSVRTLRRAPRPRYSRRCSLSHTLFLSHFLAPSQTPSLSLTHTLPPTHTLSLSLSLSVSLLQSFFLFYLPAPEGPSRTIRHLPLQGGSAERAQFPPALRARSNRRVQTLDVYWCLPESGNLWCKSRQLKKTIFYPADG